MPRRLLILLLTFAAATLAARADEWSAKELKAARKIYVAKCAKCHRFYEPRSYAEPEWSSWMEKMSRKSKLKPEQTLLLNRYLDDYREGRLVGRPEKELAPTNGSPSKP